MLTAGGFSALAVLCVGVVLTQATPDADRAYVERSNNLKQISGPLGNAPAGMAKGPAMKGQGFAPDAMPVRGDAPGGAGPIPPPAPGGPEFQPKEDPGLPKAAKNDFDKGVKPLLEMAKNQDRKLEQQEKRDAIAARRPGDGREAIAPMAPVLAGGRSG